MMNVPGHAERHHHPEPHLCSPEKQLLPPNCGSVSVPVQLDFLLLSGTIHPAASHSACLLLLFLLFLLFSLAPAA